MANVPALEGSRIVDFTTYLDVRAALGVSSEEIEDAEIETDTNRTILAEAYDSLNSGILPAWVALPEDEESRNASELRFGRLVRLFATYAVANQLLNSVELFGFLKVADGRASTERTQLAFDKLRTNVQALLARVGSKLLDAYGALVPTAVIPAASTMSFAAAVGVAVDPVTNS